MAAPTVFNGRSTEPGLLSSPEGDTTITGMWTVLLAAVRAAGGVGAVVGNGIKSFTCMPLHSGSASAAPFNASANREECQVVGGG